jgi:hypothetical protein
MITESLSDIRDRIHKKSGEYFTFAYGRRDHASWRMFYGATDALSDASMAARAFSKAIRSDPAINLLVCYGFLQAIYIQQDAVWTLSRAVEIKWRPNDNPKLRQIRDMRNRLTGHPAIAGENSKPKRLSSAIISYDRVSSDSFKGSIYFEDHFEPVVVSVVDVLNDNEAQLSLQMLEIERKMDEQEQNFRAEQSKTLLASEFGQPFDYLLRRLHCDLNDDGRVGQAQAHLKMIREILDRLKEQLDTRGFGSTAITYDFGRIFTGLGLLDSIMHKEKYTEADQHMLDLVYDGIEKNIKELRNLIDDLDRHLKAPIE